jgi:hypothetical protein
MEDKWKTNGRQQWKTNGRQQWKTIEDDGRMHAAMRVLLATSTNATRIRA